MTYKERIDQINNRVVESKEDLAEAINSTGIEVSNNQPYSNYSNIIRNDLIYPYYALVNDNRDWTNTGKYNGVNIVSNGDGTKYLSNNGTYNTLNQYSITQSSHNTAFSLPNGNSTQVITQTMNRSGYFEVEFIGYLTANVSAVLAVLTSDAVFASVTIQFYVNNTLQYQAFQQVSRSGNQQADLSRVNEKVILNLNSGDIVSVNIRANEAGINLPNTETTRLLIKG